MEDSQNRYIATDIIDDPSVSKFATAWIEDFRASYSNIITSDLATSSSTCRTLVRAAWMAEALRVFDGVLEHLDRLHHQGVCYLDIDMFHVKIDSNTNNVRPARSSNSEILLHGRVHIDPQRDFSVAASFAAPEIQTTPSGFLGAAAAVWRTGTLVRKERASFVGTTSAFHQRCTPSFKGW